MILSKEQLNAHTIAGYINTSKVTRVSTAMPQDRNQWPVHGYLFSIVVCICAHQLSLNYHLNNDIPTKLVCTLPDG